MGSPRAQNSGNMLPPLSDHRTNDPSPCPTENHVEHTSCSAGRAILERPQSVASTNLGHGQVQPSLAVNTKTDADREGSDTHANASTEQTLCVDHAAAVNDSKDANLVGLPDIGASHDGADVGPPPLACPADVPPSRDHLPSTACTDAGAKARGRGLTAHVPNDEGTS